MTDCSLLLDENLSESILRALLTEFPASQHVRLALREGATDEEVWAHARSNQLVLVMRDGDFQRLSVLRGAPPKVVWLQGHTICATPRSYACCVATARRSVPSWPTLR